MASTGPPPEGNIDHGTSLIIYTCIVVGLTAVVVAARLAVRIGVTKSFGWDDWTILFAILGNIIGGALDLVEIHYGFGRPSAYLDKWQLIEFRKYTYGEWIQTFATLMWTKVSICLFLIRIPVTKALIRPLQGAVVFLIVSNLILTLLWILQCRPVNAAWNDDVKGSCFSRGQLQRIIISQAIISVISDFSFSAYPILILWRVQMKLKLKIAICCLMGVGVLTGSCCIVRTVLNYQAVPQDYTYGGITNWYWRTAEVQIGIVAACTPALRPGVRWVQNAFRSKRSSKGHTQLTDEMHLRQFGPATATNTLKPELTSRRSYQVSDSEIGLQPHQGPGQIKKTTAVDVELS